MWAPQRCRWTEKNNLLTAARDADLEAVTALLDRGADPNAVDDIGWSPLMNAASFSHARSVPIMSLLLERRADVDQASHDGWNPLLIAAQRGNCPMVTMLIEKGANVNATTRRGVSPLLTSTTQRHSAVVQALLSAGADPTLRPFWSMWTADRSAQESARNAGCGDIEELLEDAMLPRILTVSAQMLSEELQLTCTTVAGNIAATMTWPLDALAAELPAKVVKAVRDSGFQGLREPLGPWNLRLLKPGGDGTRLLVTRSAPTVAQQFGLVEPPVQKAKRRRQRRRRNRAAYMW